MNKVATEILILISTVNKTQAPWNIDCKYIESLLTRITSSKTHQASAASIWCSMKVNKLTSLKTYQVTAAKRWSSIKVNKLTLNQTTTQLKTQPTMKITKLSTYAGHTVKTSCLMRAKIISVKSEVTPPQIQDV
jgi:hypothetical protein